MTKESDLATVSISPRLGTISLWNKGELLLERPFPFAADTEVNHTISFYYGLLSPIFMTANQVSENVIMRVFYPFYTQFLFHDRFQAIICHQKEKQEGIANS